MSGKKTIGRVVQPKSSLADKLAAAGFRGIEQPPAEPVPASRETVPEISEHDLERADRPRSVADVLVWAQAWFDEVVQRGHEAVIRERKITRVAPCFSPCSDPELESVERQIGFRLPPSVRAFYRELGGIAWGHNLQTLPLSLVVAEQSTLLERLANKAELARYRNALRVAPVCGIDGDYDFMLANVTLPSGEHPIYFVRHDDDGVFPRGESMAQLLVHRLGELMQEMADEK